MKKRNISLTLVLAIVMMVAVNASAASSVAVALTSNVKSVQSGYALLDASKMYCEVAPASKYPIKFEAYGKNDTTGTVYSNGRVVYNVNGKGTQSLTKTSYNYHSIKLTGWDVTTAKKNCIGWGKIY